MNSTPIKEVKELKLKYLLQESENIIDSIEKNWHKDRKFEYKLNGHGKTKVGVQTYHNDGLNGDYWCARVSDLDEFGASFKDNAFAKLEKYVIGSLDKLDSTHTNHEKEFIEEVTDFKLFPITLDSSGLTSPCFSYLAEIAYTFQFPLKKRVFYELICIFKIRTSEAYVVSLAVAPSNFYSLSFSDYIHARYTSIEKLSYDNTSNKFNWTMCTCSTPGGLVPNWLTKMSLNKAVAKDVPCFLNWAEKKNPTI